MPDPITTLGLTKTASEVVKEAMEFARNAKNTQLAEKLVDLYRDMMSMAEANQELRKEIEELKGHAEVASRLRFDFEDGSYFLRDGQNEDGPFCGTCWDIDNKLVRKSATGGYGLIVCNYCYNHRSKKR
ncbi:MAG: hypothetical protein WCA49_05900 [Candidatus Sulfotelmatobacter sp.]